MRDREALDGATGKTEPQSSTGPQEAEAQQRVALHPVPQPETSEAQAQSKLWTDFAAAQTERDYLLAWLALQCQMIDNVQTGLLLFQDEEREGFTPAAIWPDRLRDMTYLRAAAEEALEKRRGVIRRPEPEEASEGIHVAYPVELGTEIHGVALIDLAPRPNDELQTAMRQLHWGVGWLQAYLLRKKAAREQGRIDRSAIALDVLAVAEEHLQVEAATMAVANELAGRLDCDRVSIGLITNDRGKDRRIRLIAMSHSAWFKRKSSLVDELENAMEEAMDQNATITYPPARENDRRIAIAHRDYGLAWKSKFVASFVLTDRGSPVGAITVERRGGEPFDEESLLIGEATAALLGSVLYLKKRARRWVSGRIADAVREGQRRLFGPRYPTVKLLTSLAVILVAFAVFYPAEFRIAGDAVLEGASQRAAVAPFEGFIAKAPARAGDVVQRGDLLAALDDKDLRLDAMRWESERAKLQQQERSALADQNRPELALLSAQIRQAEAQLALTQEKLRRTHIVAPVDGLVISGDLSQQLGSPVEQGKVLFELAPLTEYRIVLQIDERDIRYLEVGQRGRLVLSGLAGQSHDMTVDRITAVASAEDGSNTFRVEAAPNTPMTGLRPGMEGVGKIVIDRRSLAWIWSRRMIDWARVFIWTWVP